MEACGAGGGADAARRAEAREGVAVDMLTDYREGGTPTTKKKPHRSRSKRGGWGSWGTRQGRAAESTKSHASFT